MTPSSSKYLATGGGGDNQEQLAGGGSLKGGASTIMVGELGSETKRKDVFCSKHPEKAIEYFCKQCNLVVCSKCMFLDHNGHELA